MSDLGTPGVFTRAYRWVANQFEGTASAQTSSGGSSQQPPANPGGNLPQPEQVPGEIVVKFKPHVAINENTRNANIHSVNALLQKHGVHQAEKVFKGQPKHLPNDTRTRMGPLPDLSNIHRLKVPQGRDIRSIIDEFKRDPNVEYAEPNYIRHTCDTIPNDPLFSQQWALTKIQAPQAWDIERGNPNVVVAVIDTGVDYNHPDIAANIWVNPDEVASNGFDDDNNSYIDDFRGWNFVSATPDMCAPDEVCNGRNNDPMDHFGHGTHVAGIIAAVPNNGVGIAGINWNAKIMALKAGFKDINGRGSLLESDSADAIKYAADNGAKIINMSWGGYLPSNLINDTLNYAYNSGVILIAGAGNDYTREPLYPSSLPWIISVGATDFVDGRFLNLGNRIDVHAPGLFILSLRANGSQMCEPYNGDANYCTASGTSMATPHVSGLVSLLLSRSPTLAFPQVRSILWNSSDDLGNPGLDPYFGHGRINAYRALTQASTASAYIKSFITNPVPYQHFGGDQNIDIMGIASGSDFKKYSLYIAAGENPTNFSQIGFSLPNNGASPIADGKLGTFNTSTLIDSGYYTIKLIVEGYQGTNEYFIPFVFDPDLEPGWPKTVGTGGSYWNYTSAPIIEDLDSDGSSEIIFNCAVDSSINVWNKKGETVSGWPQYYSGKAGIVAIGDLDNDGQKEIVASTDSNLLYAWHSDGTLMAGFPVNAPSSNVSLGDINNDGKLEIIGGAASTPTENSKIYVLNGNGAFLPGFPVLLEPNSGPNLPASICDIDGDGNPEIIFGMWGQNKAYAINNQGMILNGWPVNLPAWTSQPISCADINNDGHLELIVSSQQNQYGAINILDHSGNNLSSWPKIFNNWTSAGIPIDMNSDGYLDIVVTAGSSINVWDRNGSALPGWPRSFLNEAPYFVISGNIFNSGKNEFLINSAKDDSPYYSSFNSSRLHLFNQDGEIAAWNWPKPVEGQIANPPALGNIDNSGASYLAVSSVFYSGNKVFLYKTPVQSSSAENPWPQYGHDSKRSGNYHADVIPPVISHTPIATAGLKTTIAINAQISDNKAVRAAKVFYKNTNSSNFQPYSMFHTSGNNWIGLIPSNNVTLDGVQYYLVAHDTSVNPAILPLGAPKNAYKITVIDNKPPSITHPPITSAICGNDLPVQAQILDDDSLKNVTLYYGNGTISPMTWMSTSMVFSLGNIYNATIPAAWVALPGLRYYIQAEDRSNNSITSPAGSPANFYAVSVADNSPPSIGHTPITNANVAEDLSISAVISDSCDPDAGAMLFYRIASTGSWQNVQMANMGGALSSRIPAEFITTAGLEYYIEAEDHSNNISSSPAGAPGNVYYVTVTDHLPPIINHAPVDHANEFEDLNFIAGIEDDSKIIPSAEVFFKRPDWQDWQAFPMSNIGNIFTATIPGNLVTTLGLPNWLVDFRVIYYISALDSSGNSTASPASAPADFYSIYVTHKPGPVDSTPPTITHQPITEAAAGMALLITTDITDDISGVGSAKLYYRHKDKYDWKNIDFELKGADFYSAYIPDKDMIDGNMEYYIEAKDKKGNTAKSDTYAVKVIKYMISTGCGCSIGR